MKEAREGDTVEVHYEGRLPDGEVFESTQDAEPLSFVAGGSDVIPGVATAVVGMKEGETKTVVVEPTDAYGEHRPELLKAVPKELLPEGVQKGDRLKAQGEGQEFVVWIREISDEEAVVDANHPLAGVTLQFDLTVVSIT